MTCRRLVFFSLSDDYVDSDVLIYLSVRYTLYWEFKALIHTWNLRSEVFLEMKFLTVGL
jgi:hypothetical protein